MAKKKKFRPKYIRYWNFLSNGTTGTKSMWWYTVCPGVGFKAVSLGKTRKTWFRGTEHLIMYRNNLAKRNNIFFDWVSESDLMER